MDAGVAWKAFERIVLDDTTIWEELSIRARKNYEIPKTMNDHVPPYFEDFLIR